MNLSARFIQRPVATSLLMLVLLLFGVAGYVVMPLAALPQVELPTIQVSASLPGASPEVMATSVATPLERQLALIPGITEMTSSSSQGDTSITIQFELNRNIDAAVQDVQAAITSASGLLPHTMPSPPSVEKANPADFQIMSIAVTSDVLPLQQVNVYADTYIAQQLSRISGVGLVDLHGEQKPAIRVEIDPGKLNTLGLSLEQVRAVLGSATANAPKGTLDGPKRSVAVDVTDQLTKASEYDSLILAWRNGAPIRVRDIGRAIDGPQDVKQAAWIQGKRAIIVDIHKQPGGNVVQTVDEIRRLLPDLVGSLPASVKAEVVNDRTQTIRASVTDVQRTLMLTVALVVFVVFLFLHGFWATLIPALAIPLSIAGTIGILSFAGYSIDNLSLMGITIAVGFVIDDAIVVIENIIRHIEDGEDPLQASLNGVGQVSFTVVSMTLSLIAALIPLLFMSGVVGRLFREFAITVSVALLMSGIVSLTATPMLCRVLLHLDQRHRLGWFARASESAFRKLAGAYERALARVLRHRFITITTTAVILMITMTLFWFIPKGFFPQQDTGQIIGVSQAPTDISAPAMALRQSALVRLVMDDPDVDKIYSWTNSSPLNEGRLVINLKPFAQRSSDAGQIAARLKKKVAGLPGIELHLRTRQELQVGGRSSATQFQYTLEETDIGELYAWTPRLIERLKTLKQLDDVTSDLQNAAPRVTVVIDRDRAAQFGISPQVIDDTLYDALGQREVGTIFTQIDQYHIIMELDPSHKLDVSALQQIRLPSSTGQLVPLASIATFKDAQLPTQVNHQGQFPAVTLSFNLATGVALGDAVSVVSMAIKNMALPSTLHGSFQGNAKAFQASTSSQPWLILAAILAVYVVLGILYESYIHPLTILSTLPSAGLGALLALWLLHFELNVISMIGIILLVGIVKKNAIMMVDVALDLERNQRISSLDAIFAACKLRFRPIMMTTGAAILGAVPLALGTGAGSELRAPVGVALVGGLLVSQALTLFTTPVIYLYLDRLALLLRPKAQTKAS
ncbi:efflux RND transporter permease subunit [Rhodoferax sp.]|uniref:efflux RND transporter permease subunit n=1 Tax=Rhodoferax sp. TaxID=50421 RepID=UPI0028407A25|nr:efflux RND transporter permease subunit [Rhodoferax sp.]MDR3369776.1 efflux RND transporter permease subunit [Rhodoferax sp.]